MFTKRQQLMPDLLQLEAFSLCSNVVRAVGSPSARQGPGAGGGKPQLLPPVAGPVAARRRLASLWAGGITESPPDFHEICSLTHLTIV